jgi:hypothetical protein
VGTEVAGRPQAVGNDDHPSPSRGKWMSAPTRELAQRRSGTDEVLLLWRPDSNRVELTVRDLATGVSFQLEVAPDNAIDAFYHPYAYAARRESRVAVVASIDG